MKRVTRVLSFALTLVLLLNLIPLGAVHVEAASTLSIQQLREKFPDGKYWNHADDPGPENYKNNQDGYTSVPCPEHMTVGTSVQTCNAFLPGNTQLSWQCMGYAEKLGYDATGYNPRNNANGWRTYESASALDNLKPGDIVRFDNGKNDHSIYVLGVNGDTVTYTDCNSDGHCVIRWDATISKAKLRSAFIHLRSAPGSPPPSSGCSCSSRYAGEYICTTSSMNLTIRSGHSSSSAKVGSIPSGARVTVTKASGTNSSDWAHVVYNGVSGYASMQYLKPVASAANNPEGVLDELTGGTNSVRVRGWAFDRDDLNAALKIHVYVGGICYEITANCGRPDVHNVHGCGNYHGFDATINVDKNLTGNQRVEVYAINVGGGSNVPLGSGNVNITAASVAPNVTYAEYRGVDFKNANISTQRKAALTKAMQMAMIQWTCPEDFTTWRSSKGVLNTVIATDGTASTKFLEGKTYTGIPYSMADHSYDDVAWASALNGGRITTSFMTGSYYGNGNTTAHGLDCSYMVYMALLAADVKPISYQTTATMLSSSLYTEISWEDLKPADLFLKNGHVMMFVGMSGSEYAVFECNADDAKSSYNTYTKGELSSYSCYRYRYFSNESATCNCSADYAGTYICTTSSQPLTIRSKHSSSGAKLGSIPSGARVTVTKASGTSAEDWAHVEYNGITGYASMEYLRREDAVDARLDHWLSHDKMGDKATEIKAGDWIYLCYRMYDLNTGKNLNEVAPRSYEVTETLYYPDGSVAHSYTYSDSDNNWIGARCSVPGTYTCKVEITGDWEASVTEKFQVAENPMRIHASEDTVNLVVDGQTEIEAWTTGYYDGNVSLRWDLDNSNISCSWGEWTNGKLPLTITAKKTGTTKLTLSVKDSDSGKILHSIVVNVKVKAKFFGIFFNASGGIGAPVGQTQENGTGLVISSDIPTRPGYTFLGWSTVEGATEPQYQPGDTYIGEGEVTFYAVWELGCPGEHSYSYKVTSEPTTAVTGQLSGSCSLCGDLTVISMPKLNTSDYTYQVKTAATCEKDGLGQYTWKNTDYGSWIFTQSIAKRGHSFTDYKSNGDATCTADGSKTAKCDRCSVVDTVADAGSKKPHAYTCTVTTKPTEASSGILTGICGDCKDKITVTLPKLNKNDYSYTEIKAATYTADGIGRYTWKDTSCGTFSFDITLPKKTVQIKNVEISSLPTKITYEVGEKLDTAGLALKVTYSDGSFKTVTSGYHITGFSSVNPGLCTVTVTYEGYSRAFMVNVLEKTPAPVAGKIVVERGNAAPGSTVEVAISVKNNPGISSMRLRVTYGSDLTLINVAYNSALPGSTGKPDYGRDCVYLTWENPLENVKGDWVFAVMTFRVAENAKPGKEAAITVTYDAENIAAITASGREEPVPFEAESGAIAVISKLPGDLTGDGKLNNRDVTRLMQYLAGWDVEAAVSPDINGDGKLNNRDVTRLMQYLAGWDVELS